MKGPRKNTHVSPSLPEAVVKCFHTIFGDAIRSSNRTDPAKHTGHVNYTSPGFLKERNDAQGHTDDSVQVDGQHGLVVFQGQPVAGSRGNRDSCIIDHGPQTCQSWESFSASCHQ